MFIRETHNKRKDGTIVTYIHLVESVWDKKKKGPRHKIIHSFGKKDELNVEQIRRLVNNLKRYLNPKEGVGSDFKQFNGATSFGLPYLLDQLWHQLEIDQFFKNVLKARQFQAPIERALFAMVAQRVCGDWSCCFTVVKP